MTQGVAPTNNSVFRSLFYPPSYSGFNNVSLTPGDEIEINPIIPSLCLITGTNKIDVNDFILFPNLTADFIELKVDDKIASFDIDIYDLQGKMVKHIKTVNSENTISIFDLAKGQYLINLIDKGKKIATKMVVVE